MRAWLRVNHDILVDTVWWWAVGTVPLTAN